MPRRALVERRPWLLASVAAAIAYYALKDADFPGAYLLAIEAASLLLLGVYALLRHTGRASWMLAAAMALGGIGVVAVELDPYLGTLALTAGLAMLIGVFLQHRRKALTNSQKATIIALLILTPAIAWLLAAGNTAWPTITTFGLALGATACAAWASNYPRYRVGAGAVLYVAASLLSIATSGPLHDDTAASILAWPLYYFGHFLICTGVIQTLRRNAAR